MVRQLPNLGAGRQSFCRPPISKNYIQIGPMPLNEPAWRVICPGSVFSLSHVGAVVEDGVNESR
jgi:hypothetical protein